MNSRKNHRINFKDQMYVWLFVAMWVHTGQDMYIFNKFIPMMFKLRKLREEMSY